MTTVLKTEGLNKTYQLGSFPRNITVRALNDVNLSVESDDPVIISIVGESGSGKTTLAKVILRLVEPTSGSATVADRVVAGKGAKPDRAQFLRTVQPIFQNPFEAFSRYRPIDSYLFETARRVAGLNQAESGRAGDEALDGGGVGG